MTTRKKNPNPEAPSPTTTPTWRNANDGEEDVNPRDLLANPHNARRHTEFQRQVWREIMQKRPFIGRIVVNRRTKRIIDGHLRWEEALKSNQPTIPVQWENLTDEEEEFAVSMYDAINGLATTDTKMIEDYYRRMDWVGEATDSFMQMLARPEVETTHDWENAGPDLDDDDEDDFIADYKGGDKKGPTKITLKGGDADEFRALLRRLGFSKEAGGKTFLIIAG